VIVDPADISSVLDPDAKNNILGWASAPTWEALIREAIELHVESLRESGEARPPTSTAERVAVGVAA
jgi:hypothetical protein